MITNTNIQTKEPKIGEVVFYKPWQGKNDNRKKAYPVLIVDGTYLSNGRLSNFWDWHRLSPTGRINPKKECGYGNFTKAEGCEVITKVKVTK